MALNDFTTAYENPTHQTPHTSHTGANPLPSSSPAFGTPVHPIISTKQLGVSKPTILPISLPPATLRPLAFRTFTKKHNLNLTSSALEVLAGFIGKNCGSGWREDGSAERILNETARQWKKSGGGVLVPGEVDELKNILKQFGSTVCPGNPIVPPTLEHVTTIGNLLQKSDSVIVSNTVDSSQAQATADIDEAETSDRPGDSRDWMQVVNAFEQPRLSYNSNHMHFENTASASKLAGPARKTAMFRQLYHLIHQRLLRNESFQNLAVKPIINGGSKGISPSPQMAQQGHKLTPIANLLGRGGSTNMLLGLLIRSPSGHLTINDLTGSIVLDTQYARPSPGDGMWLTPGMFVVVEGQYEDGEIKAGADLDGNTGVGGTIGGIFVVFGMTAPPSERRETTLGLSTNSVSGHVTDGAGFGWVDFLGVGSDRARGKSMREAERRVLRKGQQDTKGEGRCRIAILGEVNLDVPRTLQALRKVFASYAAEPADDTPMAVVLMGNFVRHATMAGGGSEGSIEYKEHFDSLASALSDYPSMLQNTTFVFVPGDNDPWSSSFSAGAATVLPHQAIPDLFTSRVRKAFATANDENERATGKKSTGEAIWSTNPTRLTFFGPCHEILLFRDDISSRFRRNAIHYAPAPKDSLVETNENGGSQQERQHKKNAYIGAASGNTTDVLPHAQNERRLALEVSPEVQTIRKLVKTVIGQGHLSPFPLSQRPVMWNYSGSLHLYPLPTALVIMDTEAPRFAVGLDGCHVMNPGPLIAPNKRGISQWVEYSLKSRRGKLREACF